MPRRSSSADIGGRRDATVWKLRFNGNYGDIVAKLGQELFEDVVKIQKAHELLENLPPQMQTGAGKQLIQETLTKFSEFTQGLSQDQQVLRDVCIEMNFPGRTCRPSWANGAHVFVTPFIASEIQDAFEGGELSKGHIIVSDCFRDVIHRMLSEQSPTEFMRNRGAGQPKLRREDEVTLATFSFSDAALARADVSLAEKQLDPISYKLQDDGTFVEASRVKVSNDPSLSTRQTHTTGSRPRSQQASKRSYGPKRKNFQLCKLAQPVACGAGSLGGAQSSSNSPNEPMCLETASHDGSGQNCDSHDWSEPGPVAGNANNHGPEFDDVRSQSSMYTCETSLTIEGESKEEMLERILSVVDEIGHVPSFMDRYQAAMTEFEDEMQSFQQAQRIADETGILEQRLVNLPEKPTKVSTFGRHVKSCMQKLVHQIVPSLLQAEALEARLASLSHDAGVSLEHAKIGQDRLAEVIRSCCSKQVLLQMLGVESDLAPAESLAADLESAILPLFKRANRHKRVSLKNIMSARQHPESLHEVADLLKAMVFEALEEAMGQVDVVHMAENSWQMSNLSCRLPSAPLSSHSRWQPSLLLDDSLDIPDWAAHMIERQQKRRAREMRKGNAPGTLHGKPSVRGGRVTGIRPNANEFSRLHHN